MKTDERALDSVVETLAITVCFCQGIWIRGKYFGPHITLIVLSYGDNYKHCWFRLKSVSMYIREQDNTVMHSTWPLYLQAGKAKRRTICLYLFTYTCSLYRNSWFTAESPLLELGYYSVFPRSFILTQRLYCTCTNYRRCANDVMRPRDPLPPPFSVASKLLPPSRVVHACFVVRL